MKQYNTIRWENAQTDESLWKWMQENRDIIALEEIVVYTRAIYNTIAVTAVALMSWLFFKKQNED